MTYFTFRTGLAGALLLGAATAAQAADMPRMYKAQPLVAPLAADWTGFYIGINAGYGFGKSDWDAAGVSPEPSGVLAGVTVGYNFQTGLWLWGLEGDIDYSGMKGDEACGPGSCETKNTWLGTARARVGYTGWSNWLPYLTGGAAFGDVKASSPLGDGSETKIGWTAGAGVEYAMLPRWSVKVEYLYLDLGSVDCSGTCGDSVSFKANAVRAGLNYRF